MERRKVSQKHAAVESITRLFLVVAIVGVFTTAMVLAMVKSNSQAQAVLVVVAPFLGAVIRHYFREKETATSLDDTQES